MSLRLAANLIDSGAWALANAHLLQARTLLMHGSDDKLTCPEATLEFANASNGVATFKAWHGCRHDLHDDLQRERVFEHMTHWMKQQCIVSYKISRTASASVA